MSKISNIPGGVRGISVRPGEGGPDEERSKVDQPQEFSPITITGLDLDGVRDFLTENGFTHRTVNLKGEPAQLLIYRTHEVNEAEKLSGLAGSSPLRQLPPKGIVWDELSHRYLALPVLWTDALTESVTLKEQEGAVWLSTVDRDSRGTSSTRILYQEDVYTKQAWEKASQAAQLAQQDLGFPPGSPASLAESGPIQWDTQGGGSFRPDGIYTPRPGTRYGFMGWVRPKKN